MQLDNVLSRVTASMETVLITASTYKNKQTNVQLDLSHHTVSRAVQTMEVHHNTLPHKGSDGFDRKCRLDPANRYG